MIEHETIASALVAALSDLTNVTKGHTANAGKKVYTYTNISDLIAETRPALAEHGIVALTPVHHHPDGLGCTVVLLHKSGDRLDFGPFTFPSEGLDAQATGSWVTYIRRYALLSALGMGAEDDDGKSAQPAPRRQERPHGTPAGLTEKAAYNKLIDHLASGGKDEQDAVALAASVWSELKPKVVNDVLADGEWKRIVTAADERLVSA